MLSTMKGAYVLIIRIEKDVNVQIKSLGRVTFQAGTWVYVGSAMGDGSTSLENRIKRHFSSDKTIYWHIDYLLDKEVKLQKVFWAQSSTHSECDIAQQIQSRTEFQEGPRHFGSSDCQKECAAHLFGFNDVDSVEDVIEDVFKQVSLHPSISTDGQI
ncbi:MAG: DUF123 domain-containing protein [Candidatus Thorarchaeota archaeon]